MKLQAHLYVCLISRKLNKHQQDTYRQQMTTQNLEANVTVLTEEKNKLKEENSKLKAEKKEQKKNIPEKFHITSELIEELILSLTLVEISSHLRPHCPKWKTTNPN
jgi:hypothetical protein